MKKIEKIFFLIVFSVSGCFLTYAQQPEKNPVQRSIADSLPRFGLDFMPVHFNVEEEIKIDPRMILGVQKDYFYQYLNYEPKRDPKRLVYNTCIYFGAALASFGLLWVMPESVSGWDKDKIREEGLLKRWKENVRAGPEWDDDHWYFNWLIHPWAGSVYYMSARGSGFKWWESFIYSTIMSTLFWEYGVEAFAEIPSWQDIIITPTIGSVMGEGVFHLKRMIVRNDRRILRSRVIGGVVLFIFDPINIVLDGFGYKTKNKPAAESSFQPVSFDPATGKVIWGLKISTTF